MSKAFLSYVHEDEEIAEKVVRNLQRNGIGVWRDKEELAGGMRWKAAIRAAIKEGTLFLALHSENRETKLVSYAHDELTLAIDELRKRPTSVRWLIPLRVDDASIEDRTIGGGETYLDLQVHDLREFDSGMLSLLQSLSVEDPVLAEEKAKKSSRGEFTAPQGSPFAAISALEELELLGTKDAVPVEILKTAFGDNTIGDLSKLGLIKSTSRGYWSLAEPVQDAKLALAVAISKIPAFQVAVGELQKNFDESGQLLGEKIATYLGREWTKSSCQRNGAAYKRWVAVIYPNFRLPQPGEKSFLRARAAASRNPKKGRKTFLTPDILSFIGKRKHAGKNVSEIARELGIVPQTIHNWKRANPDKWDKL